MDIWSTRETSLEWLNNELKHEAEVIKSGFMFFEKCIEIFEQLGNSEGETTRGKFCRICAITLAKSNQLILGCYSLTLDALAQESGALLRPLIETYELLVYFRLDKSRVDEAINNKLPSAGKIAQKVSADFRDLRKHLNDNASHFSYKLTSVQHLFDKRANIKTFPNHSIDVFQANLNVLNAFQIFVIFEAINCLFIADYDANALVDEVEKWSDKSVSLFS